MSRVNERLAILEVILDQMTLKQPTLEYRMGSHFVRPTLSDNRREATNLLPYSDTPLVSLSLHL